MRFILLLLPILMTACSSMKTQSETPPVPEAPRARPAKPTVESADEPIDVLGLKRSLGLERAFDELGFQERSFDTCSAGYGFSASKNCRKKSFVAIQFRLQCRDSEGTAENADYQVTPVTSDQVKWMLGRTEGMTSTDTGGYGHVNYIAPNAQANAKLKLTVNGRFLIMNAAEIRSVVVPANWCL